MFKPKALDFKTSSGLSVIVTSFRLTRVDTGIHGRMSLCIVIFSSPFVLLVRVVLI
jgi:hypothetical protein